MFTKRLPASIQLAVGALIVAGGLAMSPAQAASAAWNRGCADGEPAGKPALPVGPSPVVI